MAGFIGCDRLIKRLTFELRWGVKAGDKSTDEKGSFFLSVCLVCVRVFWTPALIPDILGGQRGELDRDYNISTPCSCHSQRSTSCALPFLKDSKRTVRHRRARGDNEEILHSYHWKISFSTWHIIRWGSIPVHRDTTRSWCGSEDSALKTSWIIFHVSGNMTREPTCLQLKCLLTPPLQVDMLSR